MSAAPPSSAQQTPCAQTRVELRGLLDKGPTSHTYQNTFFKPGFVEDGELQMDSIPLKFRDTGLPGFFRFF